jgi:hypothetical protein
MAVITVWLITSTDKHTKNSALLAAYKWGPITWVVTWVVYTWAPYYTIERVTTHGLRVPLAQPSEFSLVFVLTHRSEGSTQAFPHSVRSFRSGTHCWVFVLFSLRIAAALASISVSSFLFRSMCCKVIPLNCFSRLRTTTRYCMSIGSLAE